MLHHAHYVIRPAAADDAQDLCRLAALDSQAQLAGPVLIGELDGRPAAAISLADRRVVADPFQRTAQLASYLRVRAGALGAVQAEPSLRRRILAAVPARLRPQRAAAAA